MPDSANGEKDDEEDVVLLAGMGSFPASDPPSYSPSAIGEPCREGARDALAASVGERAAPPESMEVEVVRVPGWARTLGRVAWLMVKESA